MYARTMSCPFVTLAKRVLADYGVPYREIYIDRDEAARKRVLEWTGFLSVPTLVVVPTGADVPSDAPTHLERGRSPRGIDRGCMITEPNAEELKAWLVRHGLLAEVTGD